MIMMMMRDSESIEFGYEYASIFGTVQLSIGIGTQTIIFGGRFV